MKVIVFWKNHSSNLMIEAGFPSETLESIYQITRHHFLTLKIAGTAGS
jgi:hypothetical protein